MRKKNVKIDNWKNGSTKIPKQNGLEKIKVQLDEKTVVIVNRMDSFETWKKVYPNAKIIEE